MREYFRNILNSPVHDLRDANPRLHRSPMSTSPGNAYPPGGATGALARSMDWSGSPLGSPADWSSGLRHSFSLCLDSPFFMALYWGPEFALLYGDAYLPLVADKHPRSFGRPARHVWHEFWDVIEPQLRRVVETGEGFITASQRLDMLQHGVMQEKYFSYSFMPVRDADGRVAGVLNMAHETTTEVLTERARQTAQVALDGEAALSAQTRNLLQMLTDGTPDVVYVKDTAGRIVHANDTVSRMFEMPLSDIIGHDDTHWLPPEQAAMVMANDRKVMASRQTHAVEEPLEIVGPHGPVVRHYLSTKSPWLAADGTLLGLFGISRDITELKQQEEDLRRLNETLELRVAERTAERDRIWRVSREIFVVSGMDGRFMAVNPAFERILGWTDEEALRMPFLDMVHPDDIENTQREFKRVIKGQPALGFKNRFRHRDGQYHWLNWTAVPEGEVVYSVARDITDEEAQAQTLARAEEQLRHAQKMEAVGQLTGGIAHDFNNLLATIMANLELLQRRVDSGRTDELPRYVAIARTSAQRAASLTHRLLAFSRRQSLDPRPVDLNALVTGMEDLMHRTLGENTALQTLLDPDLPPAFTDANQLESALLNLAINARDAMPEGGKLTIETRLSRLDERYTRDHSELEPGDYLQLSVSDTGMGMSAEVLSKAFDPFFTTKPIGQGTGLGLSMIYGYARQSGGHVAIYSEPGKGTSVKLYLPCYRYDNGLEDGPDGAGGFDGSGSAVAPDPVPQGAGETVLVVEDEAGVRMVVLEVLDELGYKTHEAVDATSALRIIDSGVHIDLLVSDVGLPGINGRQLAEMIRTRRPAMKVLFITGYAGQAAIRGDFLDSGMDMLAKPFTIDDLAHKIEQILQS
ncbi:MAG: PAS domain S-box protein [Comamonadaceae bacterium]|nr:MAG: PAS domain S-box protein [Comamonadaceae bacterium]